MSPFIPDSRPPQLKDGARPPRWPTIVFAACLAGLLAALIAATAWSPRAGWVFLAFACATLVSWVVRSVRLSQWESRSAGRISPVRLARWLRVVRTVWLVVVGLACALLIHELVTSPYALWPAFLIGAFIGDRILVTLILARFMTKRGYVPGAQRSELHFDLALALAATSLEQSSTDTTAWTNVVARCVAAAHAAGLEAGRSGEGKRAMHLTLKRESLYGRAENVQAAWRDVIDAARVGISAGDSQIAPTHDEKA